MLAPVPAGADVRLICAVTFVRTSSVTTLLVDAT